MLLEPPWPEIVQNEPSGPTFLDGFWMGFKNINYGAPITPHGSANPEPIPLLRLKTSLRDPQASGPSPEIVKIDILKLCLLISAARPSKKWGAEGAPQQRVALPTAEGGATRRPARPPARPTARKSSWQGASKNEPAGTRMFPAR